MPVALTTCGRILMYADQMKGYILNIKKLKKISMSKLELQGYWGIHIKFSFATITLCVEEPYVNLWSTKLSELFEGKRLRPYIHMKQNYDKEWVVKTGQRIDNLVDNKNKENVKVPETPKKEIKTPLKCNQMDTPRNGERTIIRNMNYKSPIETPVRRTQSDAITPWRSEVKGVKITDEMFIKANKNEGKSKGENVVSSPPSAKSPSLYTTTRENCCIMDKNNNNYQCDFDNVCDDFGSKRNFFKRLQQAA
uniref:Uncharacterized protein n=1 Tax=Parastrongyloides trichosuri TaxID=131310 RepID=A0A0N4ZXK3_PARTI